MRASLSLIDFEKVANSTAVNYLHHGAALDVLPALLPREDRLIAKVSLLNRLPADSHLSVQSRALIRSYEFPSTKMQLSCFRRELEDSLQWRQFFRKLGCRGFSYELDTEMNEYNQQHDPSFHVRKGVNLRLALIPSPRLFYPPRVKAMLRRVPEDSNHYILKKMPSIAFCFGRRTALAWYVFVMQSDLARYSSPYLREHFRGWRNVLFANVVACALGNTKAIYLCRVEDVERACYPGTKDTGRIPESWKAIYDGTAREWGMPLVPSPEPLNIQIYRGKKPVYAEYAYELRIDEQAGSSPAVEALCPGIP